MVQVTIGSTGTPLHGKNNGGNPLKAIDKVMATMGRRIEHYNEKLYDKRRSLTYYIGERAVITA